MSDLTAENRTPNPDRKGEVLQKSPLLQLWLDNNPDLEQRNKEIDTYLDTKATEFLDKKIGDPRLLVQAAMFLAYNTGDLYNRFLSPHEQNNLLASMMVIGYEIGDEDDLLVVKEDIKSLLGREGYYEDDVHDEVLARRRQLANAAIETGHRFKQGQLKIEEIVPDDNVAPLSEGFEEPSTPMPSVFADYLDEAGVLDNFGEKSNE